MKLTHPGTGQSIDVAASAVKVYESQGWTRTPAPVKKAAASAAAKSPASAGKDKKEKANG